MADDEDEEEAGLSLLVAPPLPLEVACDAPTPPLPEAADDGSSGGGFFFIGDRLVA